MLHHTMHKIARAALFACVICPSAVTAELLTGVTTTNALVTFDSATPGTTIAGVGVTGLQPGETILGIDRRPTNGVLNGALYALGSTTRLYIIDTVTGVATEVGSPGSFTLSGTAFGFDFNPVVDRIRVTSNTEQDLRLNPNDGTLTATDTPLAYAAGDPNAGATPRDVGAAYTNDFFGAISTTLYGIDSNLDILVRQGSIGGSPTSPNTGQLFTVGALGFNSSDLIGFDIAGATGIAYAALTAPAGNFSQLFTVNLNTGAATLVGSIGGGVPLTSLAAGVGSASAGIPEPGTLVLVGVGLAALVSRGQRPKQV